MCAARAKKQSTNKAQIREARLAGRPPPDGDGLAGGARRELQSSLECSRLSACALAGGERARLEDAERERERERERVDGLRRRLEYR